MFAAETYIHRRNQLKKQIDRGILLFIGHEESPMNFPDNVYPFRQDSSFLYYIGIDRPHYCAVMDVEEDHITLFGDDLTMDHIVWMGAHPSVSEQARRVGISRTAAYADLEKTLRAAAGKGRPIHFLPPYRAETRARLHRWLDLSPEEVNNGASEAFIRAVVSQRSVKSVEELKEMDLAVRISGLMHEAAMRAARPGIREARLAGIVEGIAVGAGGQLAYPVIMTINGQILHNHHHGNTLEPGRLVLGDFGAETGRHYAGDITRTFPVNEIFDVRQKEIYQIVWQTLEEATQSLRPGLPFRDVHLAAAQRIARGLTEIGLMQGDPEEAVSEGAHALFFPHGLGHMIGLDVHDMEDLGEEYVGYDEEVRRSEQFGLRALRLGKALQPGFTLTIEPGIYFIPQLIRQWQAEGKHEDFIRYDKLEKYYEFSGIRIEDNVAITEDGYRLLGPPVPKKLEEVEALRKNGSSL